MVKFPRAVVGTKKPTGAARGFLPVGAPCQVLGFGPFVGSVGLG